MDKKSRTIPVDSDQENNKQQQLKFLRNFLNFLEEEEEGIGGAVELLPTIYSFICNFGTRFQKHVGKKEEMKIFKSEILVMQISALQSCIADLKECLRLITLPQSKELQ